MWDSVRDNFYEFTKPMEGELLWMYQDTLGKVTIALGYLIDTEAAALAVPGDGAPFTREQDGGVASPGEISAEWQRVKADTQHTGRAQEYRNLTDLRIDSAGCAALTARRLAAFSASLAQTAEFAGMDGWPADAQLSLLSMAWAMGPAFARGGAWPVFRGACSGFDWLAAAANCNMSNSWLIKRNAVNRGLFRNAAYSVAQAADPSTLYLEVGSRRPTIRLNDSGEDVASVQRFLTFLGFYGGEATGQFDDATDAAVRSFQGSDGLGADGVVGQLTWAALGYTVPDA